MRTIHAMLAGLLLSGAAYAQETPSDVLAKNVAEAYEKANEASGAKWAIKNRRQEHRNISLKMSPPGSPPGETVEAAAVDLHLSGVEELPVRYTVFGSEDAAKAYYALANSIVPVGPPVAIPRLGDEAVMFSQDGKGEDGGGRIHVRNGRVVISLTFLKSRPSDATILAKAISEAVDAALGKAKQ